MNCIETKVFRFFDEYLDLGRPILLGLSGGPDSICLLHLYLKWQKGRLMPLHLVHVDHGWRKESRQEFEILQKLAETLSLPLHVTRLDPRLYKGNLEAESRRERLSFFDSIIQKTQSQAIMLGHHADDLAETVLKRVLEGAGIPFLSGMSAKAQVANVPILRPLLTVTKAEILRWLEDRKISYFHDATNSDERFLRARMRGTILPQLRSSFGKEFEDNLCSLAQEAELLRHYLNERVEPVLSQALIGPMGSFFDLESLLVKFGLALKKVELLHLLRVATLGASFSRAQLHLACDFLLQRASNKQILTKSALLVTDRGRAFFMPRNQEVSFEAIRLTEGIHTFGNWQVSVAGGKTDTKNHFTDAWKGILQTVLPEGDYSLTMPTSSMARLVHDEKIVPIGRYLNEKKVPNFLMRFIPAVCHKGQIVEDFLSKTPQCLKNFDNRSIIIKLNFKCDS